MKIDPISNLEIDDNIDIMFNLIKNNIKIISHIESSRIWDHQLQVKMQITIDDFRSWLNNNYTEGKSKTRLLWYKFIDYLKDIIAYGYHFKNIDQINRFTEWPDDIIEQVAKEYNYNITCSAEVCNYKIAEDKNSVYFYLIAEAFLPNEDPDVDIKVLPYPEEIERQKEEIDEDKTLDDLINELPDSEEEHIKQLMKNYEESGIKHAEIADLLYKKDQDKQTNVDLFKKLNIMPKPTHHLLNGKILTIKFALTKRLFNQAFSNIRNTNVEDAWKEFVKDVIVNPKSYDGWDNDGRAISPYMIQHGFKRISKKINIHDARLDNEGQVLRFFSDVEIE